MLRRGRAHVPGVREGDPVKQKKDGQCGANVESRGQSNRLNIYILVAAAFAVRNGQAWYYRMQAIPVWTR